MLRKIFTHPVTHFNVLVVGFLIIVQIVHTDAHYKMEAHGMCESKIE